MEEAPLMLNSYPKRLPVQTAPSNARVPGSTRTGPGGSPRGKTWVEDSSEWPDRSSKETSGQG